MFLIGFVAMAVFGLFFMDQWMHQSDGGCIASTMNGSAGPVCPMNGIELFIHHFTAYQTFFTVLVPLFVFFIVALVVLLISERSTVPGPFPLADFWAWPNAGRGDQYRSKFIAWLAIFEHSPAF